MCENQNMEKKSEDVKVVHSQHARILKEEDEIWISSEDLNTENSSEDDKSKSKQAYKKKLKLKHRKRSAPNIKIQRPSISSIPSTSGGLDERLLMPTSEDHQSRSDDSKTSDEEYSFPPISPECLSKRFSLEDWRPMKGALNMSSLEEPASAAGETRKIVNETNNFYNVLLYKLKDLKSCPVLKSAQKGNSREQEKLPDEKKTLKYLKNTPEVKQKLSFISKLDDEISEAIGSYKAEREERLKAEFEMCKSMSENKFAFERDTELFLKMCNFEERLKTYKKQAGQPLTVYVQGEESIRDTNMESECLDTSNETFQNEKNIEEHMNTVEAIPSSVGPGCPSTNFIKRNIYAAREGMMANFSLTDEEKTKIANIMKDIDDFQLDDAELDLSSESLTEIQENSRENINLCLDKDVSDHVNAFTVSENDIMRIGEINYELEKFAAEEKEQTVNKKGSAPTEVPVIKDDEFWKKYVLDQSLKDIDEKLENLYKSYIEDEEKIKRNVRPVEEIFGVDVED